MVFNDPVIHFDKWFSKLKSHFQLYSLIFKVAKRHLNYLLFTVHYSLFTLIKITAPYEGRKFPRYHPDWLTTVSPLIKSITLICGPDYCLIGFPRAARERTSAAAFIGRVSVFCPRRPCLCITAYFSPSLPFKVWLYNGNVCRWKFRDYSTVRILILSGGAHTQPICFPVPCHPTEISSICSMQQRQWWSGKTGRE